jgi:hypothetical protein
MFSTTAQWDLRGGVGDMTNGHLDWVVQYNIFTTGYLGAKIYLGVKSIDLPEGDDAKIN